MESPVRLISMYPSFPRCVCFAWTDKKTIAKRVIFPYNEIPYTVVHINHQSRHQTQSIMKINRIVYPLAARNNNTIKIWISPVPNIRHCLRMHVVKKIGTNKKIR